MTRRHPIFFKKKNTGLKKENDVKKAKVLKKAKPERAVKEEAEKKKKKRVPPTDPEKAKYYIDPDDLMKELRKFKKTKKISETLGTYLMKLANKYASSWKFNNYSYKDEFISDAICRMVQQVDKINLDHPKCNPFAYLTMMCHRVFISRIMKEKRYQQTKESLAIEKYGLSADFFNREIFDNDNSDHHKDE